MTDQTPAKVRFFEPGMRVWIRPRYADALVSFTTVVSIDNAGIVTLVDDPPRSTNELEITEEDAIRRWRPDEAARRARPWYRR